MVGQPYPALLLLLLQAPLQDLLLVGNDTTNTIDKVALVVGDEANEDLFLRGVQEHEHAHFTRGLIREVHTARLTAGLSQDTHPPSATSRAAQLGTAGPKTTGSLMAGPRGPGHPN